MGRAFLQQKRAAMTLLILIMLISLCGVCAKQSNNQFIPVTSKFQTMKFSDGYSNLWGSQHQELSQDQSSTTIWLDSSSGSGFKSLQAYKSGFFSAAIKLQAGYTAGVITALYLSNSQEFPGHHDEIDMEFLGTTPGKPYTLQTNIYISGSGDGQVLTGRELKFHLWFDPTEDFHNYSILWTPSHIIFYVDDIAIRKYPRRVSSTFPQRPLWVYGSIWDASSWATENGKYKADYRYQPFVAKFSKFILSGCPVQGSACSAEFSSSLIKSGTGGLTSQERWKMKWIQSNYLVYNYCKDRERYPQRLPECGKHYQGANGIIPN
ncbi:hypothetical protein SUGI_1112790 [Cryptomeria japonica]|uniref:probable xyloglucan endotransglucosylase/hydrolase protein 32 n=1 Tax=Cryptomeria japonica TaxID=3369 RepID=UPI0024148D8C|nr:probable xyloglucan endotransglucosylase/hydrolase protein 32 [Cryptomeria japonica]GLJ52317.1 hypothetical protein SUGI_1112790 [Cryptomeria japonica]